MIEAPDSELITAVSHDAGYCLFCHASFPGSPGNDDASVANAISNLARDEKRTLERN
jgi:hypothetical protein